MKDRQQNRVGSALQEIRNPYQNFALAQADGVVQVGEREEEDLEFRDWTVGKKLNVRLHKKNTDLGIHDRFNQLGA